MPSSHRTLIGKWAGLFLALSCGVATIWLAATNQLGLYIHPRYIIFSVSFAVVLLIGAAVALWQNQNTDKASLSGGRAIWLLFLYCGAVFTLILLPPKVLTTASVTQRGMNSSGAAVSPSSIDESLFGNNDYQQFSLRDWAALLGQTQDPSFFTGKTVDLVGFISPSERDENSFYVSRFIISCCAVDAQPVGVPVYLPGWKEAYSENSWVRVKGEFMEQQYHSSRNPAIIKPAQIEQIEQPKDPYVY